MPDLSPITREEDYLAAIAGQDVTPPDPVTRKEDWLDLIADNVAGLAEDVEDLQDVVPTPAADDSGKVLTAGADGTASWQTASGGGGVNSIYVVQTEEVTDGTDWYTVMLDPMTTVHTLMDAGTEVYVRCLATPKSGDDIFVLLRLLSYNDGSHPYVATSVYTWANLIDSAIVAKTWGEVSAPFPAQYVGKYAMPSLSMHIS